MEVQYGAEVVLYRGLVSVGLPYQGFCVCTRFYPVNYTGEVIEMYKETLDR